MLLTLARPRLMPYALALPLLGFGWAHWDRALMLRGASELGWVLVGWLLLNSGTLWMNAAMDHDEGEVLMGQAVAVPSFAGPAGLLAVIAAVVVCLPAGWVVTCACFVCAVMAVAYSHPSLAMKGHPVGGPVINWLGYGLLSPLAGWWVVGVAPNPRTLAVWGLGSLGVLGCYFAAQAFQQKEDGERGYRTLVVTHGPQFTVQAARTCIALGLFGSVVLCLAGWFPRICLVGIPLWWWIDLWFVKWAKEPNGGTELYARVLAKRMLITGLLAMALTFTEYVRASVAGEPVAGLGTAAGHPSDRPLLPPRLLRVHDARWPPGR
jgi:1,4-dihydroxy-2-naphthoate octaprenyltransferase